MFTVVEEIVALIAAELYCHVIVGAGIADAMHVKFVELPSELDIIVGIDEFS